MSIPKAVAPTPKHLELEDDVFDFDEEEMVTEPATGTNYIKFGEPMRQMIETNGLFTPSAKKFKGKFSALASRDLSPIQKEEENVPDLSLSLITAGKVSEIFSTPKNTTDPKDRQIVDLQRRIREEAMQMRDNYNV